MLTEFFLAAMESSEYREMQYPADQGSSVGWHTAIWVIVIVLVLGLAVYGVFKHKSKDDNEDAK
jgi:heme/copper-type cytochrome/quinol oxidase subunit 2